MIFIRSKDTEKIQALFRKEKAMFYINRRTGLFVVEIDGYYRSGWKLKQNQLEGFLKSGNLN